MPALYITLEKDLPDFPSGTGEGRELSRQEPALTALAKSLGLKPLMEFFSVDAEEVRGLLEDSESAEDLAIPDQQFFSAADGLATVHGLIAHIGNTSSVANIDRVLKELDLFEKVLAEAEKEKVGWCLSVDY